MYNHNDYDEDEYEDINEEVEMDQEGDKVEKEDELAEAVDKGGRCEVKELYHVLVDKKTNKYQWMDLKPPVSETAADKLKTKKEREAYAIVDYQVFNEIENEWSTSKLFINNKKLQNVLQKALEGYPGLTQHEMSSFCPPYLPFFHRWSWFMEQIEKESDEQILGYLHLLRDIIKPSLEPSFAEFEKFKQTGHISFENLDLIFNPGDLAFFSACGFHSAGVIRRGQYGVNRCGDRYFDVSVDVVDWDGRRCGLLAAQWKIYDYQGLRALTALDVAPLSGHPDKEQICASLIQRGRIFEKYRGQHFMAYTNEQEEVVNERTIVDARAYHKYGPIGFPAFANLSEIGHLTWEQSMNRYSSNPPKQDGSPMELDLSPMTDEQCMLAVSTVKSFNIETKKWRKFYNYL